MKALGGKKTCACLQCFINKFQLKQKFPILMLMHLQVLQMHLPVALQTPVRKIMFFSKIISNKFGSCCCRANTSCEAKQIPNDFQKPCSDHQLQKVPQPSKPTWVSVQDVVLNSLRPSTQPSQLLPELSHFYQTHKHKESVLLMSLWFLLVCHALTQNDAESPVDIFLSTSQKRSKTHVLTKSLYIKTWFVCLNKFECLKNVETFQAPKHDS